MSQSWSAEINDKLTELGEVWLRRILWIAESQSVLAAKLIKNSKEMEGSAHIQHGAAGRKFV